MQCSNLWEAPQAGRDARTGTNEDNCAMILPQKEEQSIPLKWVPLVTAQRAALTPTLVLMASWLKNCCRHESRKGDELGCHLGLENGSVRDYGSAGPAGQRQLEDLAGIH